VSQRGASITASMLLAVIISCCSPARVCDPDASAPLFRIEVAGGSECATLALAIPTRESVTCDGLAAEIRGVRVELAGHPGTRWTLRLERTDGAPAASCAGVLDESCACATAACTPSPSEPTLFLDLGTIDRETVDVVVGSGTYFAELCSR
jgi:hypothetical protein